MSRCNFAAARGEAVDALGVYAKNPEKHADAENLLPGLIEKARAAKFKADLRAMGQRRKRA